MLPRCSLSFSADRMFHRSAPRMFNAFQRFPRSCVLVCSTIVDRCGVVWRCCRLAKYRPGRGSDDRFCLHRHVHERPQPWDLFVPHGFGHRRIETGWNRAGRQFVVSGERSGSAIFVFGRRNGSFSRSARRHGYGVLAQLGDRRSDATQSAIVRRRSAVPRRRRSCRQKFARGELRRGSVVVLPIAADGGLRPASDFIQHHGSGPNRGRQETACESSRFRPTTALRLCAISARTESSFIASMPNRERFGRTIRRRSTRHRVPGLGMLFFIRMANSFTR